MNAQEILLRWNSLPVEQLVSRASQILPFWVSLLLVTLIAYNLAPLAWFLYPSSEDIVWAPPQPTVTAPTGPGAAKTTDDFQLIVNAHLFGTADAESVPIPEETVDAPDTRLNLSLRATIAANDDKLAHAIIADGSGDEKV